MVRSVAFEELRRYALAVRNKELKRFLPQFLSNIRTSMWLKERDERCAQKCVKFGEIRRNSEAISSWQPRNLPALIVLFYWYMASDINKQETKPQNPIKRLKTTQKAKDK